jgi:hypothetical protein
MRESPKEEDADKVEDYLANGSETFPLESLSSPRIVISKLGYLFLAALEPRQ